MIIYDAIKPMLMIANGMAFFANTKEYRKETIPWLIRKSMVNIASQISAIKT